MKKYANVQDLVSRLTDNKTFRTFFTLYLMAESDAERQVLNERFWRDAAALPKADEQLIRAELTTCFLRLPGMAAELKAKAVAAVP